MLSISVQDDEGQAYEALQVLRASEGQDAYSDMVRRLSFYMADYARLTTSAGDTIRLANSHHAQYYGMGRARMCC